MDKEIDKIITKLEGCFGIFDYLLTPVENNLLVSYIKKLQQQCKKQKERIEYLERSNNRREDTILEQRQKISDLEDNWNKLKEWASNFYNSEEVGWAGCGMRYTLEKMQELEGNDN